MLVLKKDYVHSFILLLHTVNNLSYCELSAQFLEQKKPVGKEDQNFPLDISNEMNKIQKPISNNNPFTKAPIFAVS